MTDLAKSKCTECEKPYLFDHGWLIIPPHYSYCPDCIRKRLEGYLEIEDAVQDLGRRGYGPFVWSGSDPGRASPIEKVLHNLLACAVKQDDAPLAARSHMMAAIILLLDMCPGYTTEDKDILEIIQEARTINIIHRAYAAGRLP